MATRLDQTILDMVSYMKLLCFGALNQIVAKPCQLPGSLADLSKTWLLIDCLTLGILDSAFFGYLADIQGFYNYSKCSAQIHNYSQGALL